MSKHAGAFVGCAAAVTLLFVGGAAWGTPVDAAHKAKMVRLPAGRFTMGSGRLGIVSAFMLDVTPVTAGAYAACVQAGHCSQPDQGDYCTYGDPGKLDHPVNCVYFAQAELYCRWVGKRLPTAEEREWAARGAERGTMYPWGNDPPSNQLCWNRQEGTCAAGSFPSGDTPQGVKDLAGNVYEWTLTPYNGRADVKEIRGGNWSIDDSTYVSAAYRNGAPLADRGDTLGFRCARTLSRDHR